MTIWAAFEEERPFLIPYRGRFDGFHALPVIRRGVSTPIGASPD